MKKSLLLILLFLGNLTFSFAQSEANNWFITGHKGITFTTKDGKPALLNGCRSTYLCSTISDTLGKLLFYYDDLSGKIWNRKHQAMPGSYSQLLSDAQSIIIPKPGDKKFILFI
jgi:hypothetical protein